MYNKSIQFAVALLAGLMLGSQASAAEPNAMVKELWIDGHGYEAQLTPSRINELVGSGEGRHYQGHFPEDPDSWVRVTRLEDGWQGLAFAFNRLHTIKSGGEHQQVASFSFSPGQAPQCGVDHLHADTSITPDSLASTAMAQAVSANYDTLCDRKVDGACLMLELELAFDLEFQNRFADYETRAGAIINMVEGFYKAQFGIIFDTLTLRHLETEVFSESRNSRDLLEDIQLKRSNNDISFLKEDRSLFHLITGRSFDDGVAGIAYVDSLCSSAGFGVGVSRYLQDSGTTAVVIAHELGHNFGALHDSASDLTTGDGRLLIEGNACSEDINIMSPSVRNSFQSFSSCSVDYMTNKISSLGAVEQCFNFPADAGIESAAGNPTEVGQGRAFQSIFDVIYSDASQSADGLVVEGSIGAGEGILEEVTLNGAGCIVTSSNSFSCPEAPAQASLTLSVQGIAGASPEVNLAQWVALVSNSGDVKDILSGNDTLMTQIAVNQNTDTDPDPASEDDTQDPEGQPRDTDGGSDTSGSTGGGSSGGGGSVGWFWLLAGLGGAARLARRAS